MRPLADKSSFPGNDLLSRKLLLEVPSVLKGLTAGFGMGPGVTPSLKSPRKRLINRLEVNQIRKNSVLLQVCTANRIANQVLDH